MYDSESSQDPEPIHDAKKKSTKQKKSQKAEVNRHKKSTHIEPTLEDSDSLQDPEPIFNATKKKTREPEISGLNKSTRKETTLYDSESSQDPEPIHDAKKKSTKQKKSQKAEVNRHKKSTHIEPTLEDSDSSQDPEPIHDAKKKTTKQKETQKAEPVVITLNNKTNEISPTNRKSIIIRNNEMSFRSYVSEAELSDEQEPVVTPIVSKKSHNEKVSKTRPKEPSEKKSNVNKKSKITMYEKPSPLCKKKFSRIVVTAESDSDDEDQVGHNEQPVFKVPEVPKRNLSKKQKSVNRELEGLKIKYDRELMSEFDEGIEMNDDYDHSNSPGIYRNVYRVADCERKLRIRKLYSRPYWMNGEHQFGIRYSTINPNVEMQKSNFNKKHSKKIINLLENCLDVTDHQNLIDGRVSERATRDKSSRSRSKEPRKQKKPMSDSGSTDYGGSISSAHNVSSNNQPMPSNDSDTISHLMTRFQDFGKTGSSDTSEASTSTRVHSNNLGKLNIICLNYLN